MILVIADGVVEVVASVAMVAHYYKIKWMKNIRFLTDAICTDGNVLVFGCVLAGASGSPLRGVFSAHKEIPVQQLQEAPVTLV